MGTQLTREAYATLVAEDKAWLIANAPRSLERDHIIAVLDSSVINYAPRERQNHT